MEIDRLLMACDRNLLFLSSTCLTSVTVNVAAVVVFGDCEWLMMGVPISTDGPGSLLTAKRSHPPRLVGAYDSTCLQK